MLNSRGLEKYQVIYKFSAASIVNLLPCQLALNCSFLVLLVEGMGGLSDTCLSVSVLWYALNSSYVLSLHITERLNANTQ